MNFKRFHESKNLFDVGRVRTSSIISVNSTTITKELSQYNIDIFSGTSGASTALSTLCMVLDAGTYTLSFDVVTGNAGLFLICACPYTSETRTPTKQLYDCATGKSFTLSEKSYVSLRIQQNTLAVVKDIMLNTGSQPLPYEPYDTEVWHDVPYYIHNTSTDTLTTLPADVYADGQSATVGLVGNMSQTGTPSPTTPIQPSECGDLETEGAKAGQYKIPILSGGTTTPVYLGEVESTRNIKKLVFNGTEDWTYAPNGQYQRVRIDLGDNAAVTNCMCNQYPYIFTFSECNIFVHSNLTQLSICDSVNATSLTNWTTYLAQQYAAGTPVTVWYVLATETTGIVNEPIRKIGDYADTVSGITIPTITGADSFDVLTTLKPSEASLAYTGWHDASAKEWDGSEWQ